MCSSEDDKQTQREKFEVSVVPLEEYFRLMKAVAKKTPLCLKCAQGGHMETCFSCITDNLFYCCCSMEQKWCHIQTDQVHPLHVCVIYKQTRLHGEESLTMQMNAAPSDEPAAIYSWLCWLCMKERKGEVIYIGCVDILNVCTASVVARFSALYCMEAWERSH